MTTRVLAHALRGELPGGLKLERRPVYKLVASLDPASAEYREMARAGGVRLAVVAGGLIEPIVLAAGTEHVLEGQARILWAEARALANLPVVLVDIPEQLESQLADRLRQMRQSSPEFDTEAVVRLARELTDAVRCPTEPA